MGDCTTCVNHFFGFFAQREVFPRMNHILTSHASTSEHFLPTSVVPKELRSERSQPEVSPS